MLRRFRRGRASVYIEQERIAFYSVQRTSRRHVRVRLPVALKLERTLRPGKCVAARRRRVSNRLPVVFEFMRTAGLDRNATTRHRRVHIVIGLNFTQDVGTVYCSHVECDRRVYHRLITQLLVPKRAPLTAQ